MKCNHEVEVVVIDGSFVSVCSRCGKILDVFKKEMEITVDLGNYKVAELPSSTGSIIGTPNYIN